MLVAVEQPAGLGHFLLQLPPAKPYAWRHGCCMSLASQCLQTWFWELFFHRMRLRFISWDCSLCQAPLVEVSLPTIRPHTG